jgi:hypothetical protein
MLVDVLLHVGDQCLSGLHRLVEPTSQAGAGQTLQHRAAQLSCCTYLRVRQVRKLHHVCISKQALAMRR